MKVENNFIYRLTDRLGTLAVIPLGEKGFSLDFERQNEDKLSYEKKLSGKIMFVGEAFNRLNQIENSVYRCDEQTLTILKVCNGIEKVIFVGKISLNEAEFNLDKCQIVAKFSEDKTDKCIDDGKSVKVNLFQLIYNRLTVKTKSFQGTIQTQNCFQNSPSGVSSDYWCGTGDPYAQNWTLVSYNEHSPDGVHHFVNSTWKREIVEIDCSETPDPEWVLVEDNCGTTGKKKFAKSVTLYDCQSSFEPNDEFGAYSATMDCKVLGYEGGTTSIDNGMHFSEVMKEILKGACPNLTLKSDFFQINPDNVSAINYVTGKTSTVNNIVIFQKSDVKRPTASGNASKLEITLEDMLEVLLKMFNVKWRIEGNIFRLEHVSYYSKAVGTNVMSNELKKYFEGKRIYSYQSEKIPQKERFKFKEQQGADWNMEIVYSGCVTNTKKNEVENIIDEAMTDVVFAMQNPSSDSKFVEDTGFVLVSTKKIGNEYFINSEPSTNGTRLNNVFAWVQLVRDFHYYERPMKVGKVNGVTTNFITSIPTKKGDKFAIPLNVCQTDFNPDDFVLTALGQGIVSSAKYRFNDSFLELDLLYEANQDLVPNAPPTLSGGGLFFTYKEVPKVIDVVASDPDGTISSLVVNTPPYNGTIQFNSLSQFTYTPNVGFVGNDYFSIKALDNFSEVSNVENFSIEVKPPNQAPVAQNDTFTVYQGENFYQGTSLFANDSDDNSFTLVNSNVVSSQGVAITINANGFFSYVPPVGFEGTDTFQYSIKDDAGLTSTATVTLNVMDKNKPIAVEDNYQTLLNTAFSSNGTLGREKLTANDYTPNGQTYTYTTTAETKPTTAGGSVTINGDGSFTYTPPSGFTGVDTFNYTVHNPNGSRVGLAKVSVVPMIYVKLTTSDPQTQGHAGQPVWTRSRDYTLNFYSDSGGTIPFNVNGLNFRVKIKEHHDVDDGNSSFQYDYIYLTSVLTGTSTKILDDFQWFEQYIDPDTNYQQGQTITITIEPFTYTII
jgi:hypothetical protein